MTTQPSGPRPRILIVEDSHIVATDMERALLELGYETAGIAASGAGAIQLAEQERPDLILMDVRLEGPIDGIDAATEIGRNLHIPVIFVTGSSNDELVERAGAAEPYGYLLKPWRQWELNAVILMALHQFRRAQRLFSERAWLGTMLRSLSDGVIATDAEGRVRFLNPVAEQMTGWMLAEAIDKPVNEVFVLSAITGERVSRCKLMVALSQRKPVGKARFLLHSRDGRTIPIEDSASPIVEEGHLTGAVSVFLDITDHLIRERELDQQRERLEEQVQATANALGETRAELRALSGHLMTAQEEERRRLAREIHDDFGQKTALLDMEITGALEIADNGRAGLKPVLLRMREYINDLDSGLRNVSHRLHPSVLEDLGLVPALESLIADVQRGGGVISMRVPQDPIHVSLPVATSLYRIAQEALRNALKHAPGAPIRVTLLSGPSGVQLAVEDTGPGFELDRVRARGGLGLLSMQERARLVGGTLLVISHAGEGTTILVRIPPADE